MRISDKVLSMSPAGICGPGSDTARGSASSRRPRRSTPCCRSSAGRTPGATAIARRFKARTRTLAAPPAARARTRRPATPPRSSATPSNQSAPRQPNALRQTKREQRHDRAAEADAKVSNAHRLAARVVEPPRQQDLVWQRPAADVPERVESVEQVKAPSVAT